MLIKDYVSDVYVVCDSKGGPCDELPNVHYIAASYRKPWQIVLGAQKMQQLISKLQPDIIHIHQLNLPAAVALWANRSLNIPVLATAWGSDILVNPKHSWLLKKVLQYVLNHATHFTSDSRFMADVMQQYAAKPIAITICNYGIELFYPESEKENLIFSNRRLNPLYRINKVIKAFGRFYATHREWKLVIGATGSQTDELKALAQSLHIANAVEFAGWLTGEQNYQYYAKAKIWVSVPESDATAISLLEAMYCGCVPVVSDLPANKEWITDGENGIVVSDLEEDFLGRALLINAEHCMGKNQELVIQQASKEVNRNKFLQLYRQLIQPE
jgi:glycosyltransferase involved in cell wall biosynthesis